jgi:hypothetical protein
MKPDGGREMGGQIKRLNQFSHAAFSRCSKEMDLVQSFQVRPYYEGSEILTALWVCPECGDYSFQDFEDFKKEQDDASRP